jgi:hypothetical protein
MDKDVKQWYVQKQTSGQCEIVVVDITQTEVDPAVESWGPFATQGEAIARRVGLIRGGKCQPS